MTKSLSELTIKGIFLSAKESRYKKGAIILRPEDTPSDVYFIEEGFIKIYSLAEWGDEKLTAIFHAEEIFPLLYVFDKIPLTKYYEAMGDVILKKIPAKKFLDMIDNNPLLLRQFISKTTALIDVYRNRIDNLEYTNAHARVVSRLLYLAKRFGEKRGHSILIKAPVTHKDIASSIAMTRETTSREFEKLEKKNIVRYVNKLILIHDITKLEKELSTHYDKQV